MRLTISTSQVRTIFQRILDFVVYVIVFLLSMAFVLWLMSVLEPSYFAKWFLP
jgi:multisubunit Na+/H+ antiporter MnhB subunit